MTAYDKLVQEGKALGLEVQFRKTPSNRYTIFIRSRLFDWVKLSGLAKAKIFLKGFRLGRRIS